MFRVLNYIFYNIIKFQKKISLKSTLVVLHVFATTYAQAQSKM
jgi:hypothetical protein